MNGYKDLHHDLITNCNFLHTLYYTYLLYFLLLLPLVLKYCTYLLYLSIVLTYCIYPLLLPIEISYCTPYYIQLLILLPILLTYYTYKYTTVHYKGVTCLQRGLIRGVPLYYIYLIAPAKIDAANNPGTPWYEPSISMKKYATS